MKGIYTPNYINKRRDSFSLNGNWQMGYFDKFTIDNYELNYNITLPQSVYYCVNEAGILPDPYFSMNSKQYDWVDKKEWVFKKKIYIPQSKNYGSAVLCFDGCGYYSDIYVNGNYLGTHQGLFGGPYLNIQKYITYGAENEIIVIIKAPDPNKKKNRKSNMCQYREIMPWGINNDIWFSSGDYVTFGIWRDIRIEFYQNDHINRPFLYTESIQKNNARLHFECEVCNEKTSEFDLRHNFKHGSMDFGFNDECAKDLRASDLIIDIKLIDKENGAVVYNKSYEVEKYNAKTCPYRNGKNYPNIFSCDFDVDNIKLWWPNGTGEPNLYQVIVELKKKSEKIDEIVFDTGIRTITQDYTASKKLINPREKYLFAINGKKTFIKGVDYCPDDLLYKLDENKIDWLVFLMKNAGIQMVRVWNGGNQFESDYFYQKCNENGIMVWQDMLMANNYFGGKWDNKAVYSQVAINVQRLRNNPALAVYCGGNEYNEYIEKVVSHIHYTEVALKENDWTRRYYVTTPHGGSAHIYKYDDPTFYTHNYPELPLLTESGISSFSQYKNFRKYFVQKYLLDSVTVKNDTIEYFDELEYRANCSESFFDKVLKKYAKIYARIDNMPLKDLFEITNVAVSNMYRYMAEAMRMQFPKTAGVFPWTFNRPCMMLNAYQLVDKEGDPIAPYYALKNSYSKLAAFLKLPRLVYDSNEDFSFKTFILNEEEKNVSCKLNLSLFDSCGNLLNKISKNTVCNKYLEEINIDSEQFFNGIKDTFVFIYVELVKNAQTVFSSTYCLRRSKKLNNKAFKNKYLTSSVKEFELDDDGERIVDIIKKNKGKLVVDVEEAEKDYFGYKFGLNLTNGNKMLYPISITTDEDCNMYCSDNCFLLEPDKKRKIEITVRGELPRFINIKAWNLDEIKYELKGRK